jgi:peptidoglycan/xylan/chitin deacetylase (PgdA/CDA1 family)
MKLTPRRAARLAARWGLRGVRRISRAHGLILMYHRVADARLDPWSICVSPGNFREQMRALTAMADPVPLEDLPEALRRGRSQRPVVAVTFDDGYVDNLTTARPLLAEHDVPATVFVATGLIGSGRPYWWDRLADALLGVDVLPERIALSTLAGDFVWQDRALSDSGAAGRQARQRLHMQLWSLLRLLADDHREAALEELERLPGISTSGDLSARPMDADELRQLAADGRVCIGAHTLTHPVLPALSREQKVRQVELCAAQCRDLVGETPRLFAYPYGDLDPETVDVVRAAGYTMACSTREDLVWQGDDPILLPRIAVGNWSGDAFRRRLAWYWLP